MTNKWGHFEEVDFDFRLLCWGMPNVLENNCLRLNLVCWGVPDVLEILVVG